MKSKKMSQVKLSMIFDEKKGELLIEKYASVKELMFMLTYLISIILDDIEQESDNDIVKTAFMKAVIEDKIQSILKCKNSDERQKMIAKKYQEF